MEQKVVQKAPEQAKKQTPNRTGIPTQMKMDFERRSGLSFDDVRVHYNSDKPRKIGALAYTQIPQVHIGPGQERHLRHELGHVVQQKSGIVSPTLSIGGVKICTNPDFEKRADSADIVSNEKLPGAQCSSTVAQGKFQTSLEDRLESRGRHLSELLERVGELGSTFRCLMTCYDALDDTADTKEKQKEILLQLMAILNQMRRINPPGSCEDIIEQMLSMIMLEVRFVELQYSEHLNSMDGWANYSWQIMNDSPYMRALRFISMNSFPGDRNFSDPDFPSLSAEEVIIRLSQRNVADSIESYVSDPNIVRLYRQVFYLLEKEGEFTHYSHTLGLKKIYSTDRLRIEGMLPLYESYNMKPQAGQVVSKSQDFDVDSIKNTGFVFMFIERRGNHRPETRFGKYRYSIPIKSAGKYLNRAWAVMHDMGGTGVTDRMRPIFGNLARSVKVDDQRFDQLVQALARDTRSSEYRQCLLVIAPSAYQNVCFGDCSNPCDAIIARNNLASTYLYGSDILLGIALRVANELVFAAKSFPRIRQCLNDDLIWKYIMEVVYNVQVMIPQEVIPEPPVPILVEPSTEAAGGGGEPFSPGLSRMEIDKSNSNIYRYEDLIFDVTSNTGVAGSCFWRLLRNHGISENTLQTAAAESGIKYDNYVEVYEIDRFLVYLNRHLGTKSIRIELTAFNYNGEIFFSRFVFGDGRETISMGLPYTSDGDGHYVEACRKGDGTERTQTPEKND